MSYRYEGFHRDVRTGRTRKGTLVTITEWWPPNFRRDVTFFVDGTFSSNSVTFRNVTDEEYLYLRTYM